ncbi:MAG: hydrogenase maturation nickel metallochaperone HypA [Pseudomonadota bacterium]
MHELSLATSVVDAITSQAARGDFRRVEKIILEIGALSCVDPRALEFGFEAATGGTCAEGAALEILTPPGEAQCFGCGGLVTITRAGTPCPDCGSHQLVVTRGDELKIKALEVI